jgi:hypothetical protein
MGVRGRAAVQQTVEVGAGVRGVPRPPESPQCSQINIWKHEQHIQRRVEAESRHAGTSLGAPPPTKAKMHVTVAAKCATAATWLTPFPVAQRADAWQQQTNTHCNSK